MPAQANANVIALQLEKVRDKVPLLYERDDILLTMIQQRGDVEKVSSRNMRLPLQVNPGGKAGSYNADGGDLGRGSGTQYDVAQVSPIFFRFAIEITKLVEYATTGRERAIENAAKREVANGMKQFRSFLDKLMQTAGNGVLGTISSIASTTFTMTVPSGAALVYPGQTIQVYDSTLTTNRNVAASVTTTVTAADPVTAQTITVDNVPAGTVATDVIVHDGLIGRAAGLALRHQVSPEQRDHRHLAQPQPRDVSRATRDAARQRRQRGAHADRTCASPSIKFANRWASTTSRSSSPTWPSSRNTRGKISASPSARSSRKAAQAAATISICSSPAARR